MDSFLLHLRHVRKGVVLMNDGWDDYDWCYECGGYGDDYSYDPETDEWVSNCSNCPHNKGR